MKVKGRTATEASVISIGRLTLESGRILENTELAFERAGARDAPVILICHGLTGSQEAVGTPDKPGYWARFVQKEGYIDLNKFQTISFNVLGGCNGSTGPESINPVTGHRYQADFPFVTIRDMVNAQYKALELLGISRLKAVIGGSLGGMQVLEWGIMFPNMMDIIIPLAVTPYLNDYGISFNHIARLSITNDPQWNSGFYTKEQKPEKGLSLARMVGMVTYRSGPLFNQRFNREEKNGVGKAHQETAFEVESYLNYQGEKLSSRFDPNSYLYLLKAMDMHDIGRERGGWTNAAKLIKASFFALGFGDDLLYPPESLKKFTMEVNKNNANAFFLGIDTSYSHDGFLVEFDRWGNNIKKVLEEGRDSFLQASFDNQNVIQHH